MTNKMSDYSDYVMEQAEQEYGCNCNKCCAAWDLEHQPYTKLTFVEMCAKTQELAKAHDKICYLYEINENTLFASIYYLHSGWLFMAYPGGRSVLSSRGAELKSEMI